MTGVTAIVSQGKNRTAPFFIVALVRSSVWVSLALTSMLFYAGHVFGAPVTPTIYVLGFASAMFVMNFDHLADARFEAPSNSPAPDPWIIVAGVLSACGAVACVYLMTLVTTPVRIVCLCYGVIGIAYAVPFFPLVWRRPVVWRRLKDIRGIKGWLVSAAIAFAVVALPLASTGRAVEPRIVAITVAACYLFIVSNAHMFDVRDLRYDRKVGNTTLPTLIGAARTRRWLIGANIVGLFLIATAQLSGAVPFHPELEIGVLLTIAYVLFLPDESSGVRYGLIIDGCIFAMPIAARLHELLGGGGRS